MAIPEGAGAPTGCRPNHHQPNAAIATKTTNPNSPTSKPDAPRRSVLATGGGGGSDRGATRGDTTRVGNSDSVTSVTTGTGWTSFSAGMDGPAPPIPPVRRSAPAVGGIKRPGTRRVISTSDGAFSSGSNGSCSAAVRDSACLRDDTKRVGRSSSVDPEPAPMSGIGISGIASSAVLASGIDDSADPKLSTGSGRAFGPGSTRVPPTTRRSPPAPPSSISSSSGQTKVTAADSSKPWPRTAKR